MQRTASYQTRTPRTLLALAAAGITAITLGAGVFAPSSMRMHAGTVDVVTVTSDNAVASAAPAALVTAVDVVAVREPHSVVVLAARPKPTRML